MVLLGTSQARVPQIAKSVSSSITLNNAFSGLYILINVSLYMTNYYLLSKRVQKRGSLNLAGKCRLNCLTCKSFGDMVAHLLDLPT